MDQNHDGSLKIIKNLIELEKLVNNLKNNSNKSSTYAYYYILNIYNWSKVLKPDEFPINNLKILVPNNESFNSGIFIVVDTTEKFGSYVLWPFAPEQEVNELLRCFRDTKLINWGETIIFGCIHESNLNGIMDYVKAKNYSVILTEICTTHYIPKEEALKFNIE